MDTHRDGITTWVASFAKNHFFWLVCTVYFHVRLLTFPDDGEQWENRPGHPLTIPFKWNLTGPSNAQVNCFGIE